MFTPTVVTDRPAELGMSQLLLADNGDDLGHLLAPDDLTQLSFGFTAVMAIDVRDLMRLETLYPARTGKVTLLFGKGRDDVVLMRALASRTSGHADLDDPSQAAALRSVIAVLGGRSPDGARVVAVDDTRRVLTHA